MASIDVLFETADLQLGDFWCPPGDAMWREENSIGRGWHVVFPGTSVWITHEGDRPVVANPNHAVFYNDRQAYRRDLISREGDRCVFVIAGEPLVREILTSVGDRGAVLDHPVFGFSTGPLDRGTYFLIHRLARHLREARPEPLAVREGIYHMLWQTVLAAAGMRATGPQRRSTDRAHRDMVEAAKEILALRLAEAVSLDRLAGELHVSPFHVAKVFRDRTGSTIHRYLVDLRLRTALRHLSASSGALARIATELGFASHSHFTGSFRRSFGVPPSAVRTPATALELEELTNFSEAKSLPRP